MIQANELRIGNWVKAAIRIDLADYKTPEYLQVDPVMIRDCQHYKENWAWEPIPITPQILEKCGFETINHIHGYTFYSHELSKISIYDYKTEYRGVWVTQCIHLHQLQNLYYALTGTELNYTP